MKTYGRFRLKEAGSAWVLETSPGLRLLYGAMAVMLGSALILALLSGVALGGTSAGGTVGGLLLFIAMLLACIWTAAYRRAFYFDLTARQCTKKTSLFTVQISTLSHQLGPASRLRLDRILLSQKENGKSLTKLSLDTGEQLIVLDDSSDFLALQGLANALALATGLEVEEQSSR